MFLDLLEATALLLALSLLHGLNLRVWRRSALAAQIGSGMIFGGLAVVGMMIPIEIAPGVIFDGRAVVLSMAALFGGPLVGALGGAIAGAYRLALGGDGALVGTIVILAAVTAGLAYRAAVTHGRLTRAPVRLLGFGLLLHGFNLLLFLLIPDKYVGAIFGELALPYVLALAPATALLGTLLLDIERRQSTDHALAQSEASLRAIAGAIPDLLLVIDEDGRYQEVISQGDDLLYAAAGEVRGRLMHDVLPPDKADLFLAFVRRTLASGVTERLEYELDTRSGPRAFEGHCRALETPLKGKRAVVLLARDVTERARLEQEQRIAAIAFDSQQGMVITAPDTTILRVNKAFSQITGYAPEEVIGRKTAMLASGRHGPAFFRAIKSRLDLRGAWEGEIWSRRRNGEVFPERLAVSSVRDAQGALTHYVGAFTDITLNKAAEAEIHTLAFYDHLTSLPNRRLLGERLEAALTASRRTGAHGALMFIDLDDFKNVNDLLGHHHGDLLLQQTGRRLRETVRQTDTVARLGGDEFVLLLEHLAHAPDEAAAQAERVARTALERLNQPYVLGECTRQIGASIGIVMFQRETCTAKDLMQRADLSMYESKRVGKNTLRFFDPLMHDAVRARLQLEDDLRAGLAAGQFTMYYQPQFDRERRIVGAEAVVRWVRPGGEPVSPEDFLPVAERAGLMRTLGRLVIEAVCAQLARWAREPDTAGLTVSLNVSASQLYQPGFAEETLKAIHHSGAPARSIVVELTESLVLSDMEEAIVVMRRLLAHGIRFSIDDFGTGYSSLSNLLRLPLDELKIDQSFVHGLPEDSGSLAIVKTIVALASALELNVVAEGVETPAQQAILEAQGCRVFQGFLFARPLPVEEFEALLRAGPPAAEPARLTGSAA